MELVEVILEGEGVGAHLAHHVRSLFLLEALLRLLDEAEHVAHAEYARGHAVRVEGLDVGELFADAGELDGLARDRAHGDGRAAAGVAVQLGEDDAIHAQLLVEGIGDGDGVLTGHGVDDEEDLLRLDRGADLAQLLHELLVDVQTAGGVDDDRVAAIVARVFHGLFGDLHRIALALFKDLHAHLSADDLQLLDGCGAVDVAGDEQGLFAALLDEVAELGGHGGLARALQSAEHVDGRRLGGIGQFGVGAAHELGQFVVYDLDDLLAGREAAQNLLPHGALGDLFDEILDDCEVDVGLQKRHAHFAHRGLDVRLAELALAGQLFERILQFIGQALECHARSPLDLQYVDKAISRRPGIARVQRFEAGLRLLRDGQIAAHEAEFCLVFLEFFAGGGHAVAHRLAGNAHLRADLGEGHVLFIAHAQHLAPLGGKERAVKIQQIGGLHARFHGRSPCKANSLATIL